jgi:hypothetical protein
MWKIVCANRGLYECMWASLDGDCVRLCSAQLLVKDVQIIARDCETQKVDEGLQEKLKLHMYVWHFDRLYVTLTTMCN